MEQQILELVMKLVSLSPVAALIVGILGTLVVIAQVIIPMTPSKSDDAAWDKVKSVPVLGALISALTNFAVIQKK